MKTQRAQIVGRIWASCSDTGDPAAVDTHPLAPDPPPPPGTGGRSGHSLPQTGLPEEEPQSWKGPHAGQDFWQKKDTGLNNTDSYHEKCSLLSRSPDLCKERVWVSCSYIPTGAFPSRVSLCTKRERPWAQSPRATAAPSWT